MTTLEDYTACLARRHDLGYPQLASSINNAIGLIGKFDVLRIIAEEIEF